MDFSFFFHFPITRILNKHKLIVYQYIKNLIITLITRKVLDIFIFYIIL